MITQIKRTHIHAAVGGKVKNVDTGVALCNVITLAHIALQRRDEDFIEATVRDDANMPWCPQ